MSSSLFLIDGYNLIHALRLLDGGSPLESARQALEVRLRAFLSRTPRGTRILLVYDGAEVGLESGRGEGPLAVRFARPPLRADDLILQAARQHEGPGQLQVVTSDDFDIGRPLRAIGIEVVPAREFARRLGDLPGDRPGAGRRRERGQPGASASLGAPEVDRWVREFGLGEGPPGSEPPRDDPPTPGEGAGEEESSR